MADLAALATNSDYVRHERVVLSGMLMDAAALEDGLAGLEVSDFQLHSHQILFESIGALHGQGDPVEPLSLGRFLQQRRLEQAIGGMPYVLALMDDSIRNRDIRHYVKQVKEFAALNRLAKLCERVMLEAMQGTRTSGELIAEVEATAKDIQSGSQQDEMVDVGAVMPTVVGRILNPEQRPAAMPTGIDRIDVLTMGGIRPGELWVWGGLPGRGKSAVGRQVARSVATNGHAVDVFSIEMPKEDWAELDLATEAGVPHWKVRANALNREDRAALIATSDRLCNQWKVRYEDSGSLHLRTLIAKARISVMRRQTKMVVVDYVQRVKTNDKEIRIRVGNVAEALAEFAKEMGCAVVLLSQLARRGDVNVRPTMQDLKEAGELEAHAHTVLLNYRPINRDGGTGQREEFSGEDEIIVAKQRYGPVGSALVSYDHNFLRFDSRAG